MLQIVYGSEKTYTYIYGEANEVNTLPKKFKPYIKLFLLFMITPLNQFFCYYCLQTLIVLENLKKSLDISAYVNGLEGKVWTIFFLGPKWTRFFFGQIKWTRLTIANCMLMHGFLWLRGPMNGWHVGRENDVDNSFFLANLDKSWLVWFYLKQMPSLKHKFRCPEVGPSILRT